ncbi:RNase H domain-containing protein [Trichonephila clavipes]|nr:RNase H domain-containing protein [Trichonephila clavipes]
MGAWAVVSGVRGACRENNGGVTHSCRERGHPAETASREEVRRRTLTPRLTRGPDGFPSRCNWMTEWLRGGQLGCCHLSKDNAGKKHWLDGDCEFHCPLASLIGNEVADDLAKAATSNPVDPEDHMVLTSTEIYTRAKELIYRDWVVSPVHPWYFQRHPRSVISFKGSRSYQTAFSRFSIGHLRRMNFEGGKRSFPICPKCNISPFSPQHILQCLGVSCEEAVASPCCS